MTPDVDMWRCEATSLAILEASEKYVILLYHLVRNGIIVIFQRFLNFSKYLSIFAISAKYLLVFVRPTQYLAPIDLE